MSIQLRAFPNSFDTCAAFSLDSPMTVCRVPPRSSDYLLLGDRVDAEVRADPIAKLQQLGDGM